MEKYFKELKQYLFIHPTATLEEFKQYYVKTKFFEELDNNKEYAQWFKTLIGKYFVVKINGDAEIFYFKVDHVSDDTAKTHTIYKFINHTNLDGDYQQSLKFEWDKEIPLYIFDNPYSTVDLDYDVNKIEVFEISEFEYSHMKEEVNGLLDVFNQIEHIQTKHIENE